MTSTSCTCRRKLYWWEIYFYFIKSGILNGRRRARKRRCVKTDWEDWERIGIKWERIGRGSEEYWEDGERRGERGRKTVWSK